MKPITVRQVGTGSTAWQQVNWHIAPIQIGYGVTVDGMSGWSVEATYDDVLTNLSPEVFELANGAGTDRGSIDTPVGYFRLTVTSGVGTVALTYIQAGIAGN